MILGSLGGIVMNTAVVLPAILLGRAIDTATAWNAGQGTGADVLRAGLLYVGGMALYQGARLVKRWGLRVGHQRIMAASAPMPCAACWPGRSKSCTRPRSVT